MVYGMTDLTWHQTIHAFLASDQTSRLGCMIYIGPGISLVLDLNIKLESRQAIQIRPGEEIRHRRVTQCVELQVVAQDACLPSHA